MARDPVVEITILLARSPPTTELKVGVPEVLPCKSVVVVPARVPKSPAAELVTTPAVLKPESVTEVLAVTVVKVAAPGVVPPIVPGSANVFPLSWAAFKLLTTVVELTVNGAVPVVTVDWICPELAILSSGELKKLVKPVAEAKLIPLITLELVLVAAGKLTPLTVFELLALVPLVRSKLTPLTAVAPTAALALVTAKLSNFEPSAVKAASEKETIVPEVAEEVTVSAERVPMPVMLANDPAVRSPLTTPPKLGSPDALPCKTVVVVPAKVPIKPPEVLVTTPAVDNPTSVTEVLAVTVVNVAAPGVVPPIVPGAAKVAPFRSEAFKFETTVVDETEKGAVPVLTVETICLAVLSPPLASK